MASIDKASAYPSIQFLHIGACFGLVEGLAVGAIESGVAGAIVGTLLGLPFGACGGMAVGWITLNRRQPLTTQLPHIVLLLSLPVFLAVLTVGMAANPQPMMTLLLLLVSPCIGIVTFVVITHERRAVVVGSLFGAVIVATLFGASPFEFEGVPHLVGMVTVVLGGALIGATAGGLTIGLVALIVRRLIRRFRA